MPRHTEPSANSALGAVLQRMLPSYDVRSETTRQIVDNPNLRPDILIAAPGRSPVVVEAEFMPAYAAEDEARDRGSEIRQQGVQERRRYAERVWADAVGLEQSGRLGYVGAGRGAASRRSPGDLRPPKPAPKCPTVSGTATL